MNTKVAKKAKSKEGKKKEVTIFLLTKGTRQSIDTFEFVDKLLCKGGSPPLIMSYC